MLWQQEALYRLAQMDSTKYTNLQRQHPLRLFLLLQEEKLNILSSQAVVVAPIFMAAVAVAVFFSHQVMP
jgi:hypothetical protein